MRSIGMDVHRDFCEIAIAESGAVRAARRIETTPAALELFARSLTPTDEVAIKARVNALAIARIIEPHVRRVVLANPKAVRETSRRAKRAVPGRVEALKPGRSVLAEGESARTPRPAQVQRRAQGAGRAPRV